MDNQQGSLFCLRPEDIGNQARVLLVEFIRQRMISDGLQTAVEEDLLMSPDAARGPQLQHAQEVGEALRIIGDQLDGDRHLQTLIGRISPNNPQQSFLQVAQELFSDGVYNWGRVVALFYFGYRLVMRAVSISLWSMLRSIVDWVVQFIVERVARWIIDRGGWEAIQEYVGATNIQFAAVAIAAVSACAFIYWKSTR